ncbi:MAG: 16S rRNA (guanine(527)-N(7))-methyltransferase RsmG [Variibacter sp.]|nr:16S rRNA (guanine(527)-N(7))-methyltransferase RsmG [Variibacter sp.]
MRDRDRALALTPVSHETAARLDRFVALLLTWQSKINLIAPSTVPELWTRHVADSLQLLACAPDARVWLDLGSGGGFPGIPIGCALAAVPGGRITLVESDTRKAAFLREAIRATRIPATVVAQRIESASGALSGIEVVTARALAPLAKLLALAEPFLQSGAKGVFPKGQDVEAELTEAAKSWHIEAELQSSVTEPAARILVVHRAFRRQPSRP